MKKLALLVIALCLFFTFSSVNVMAGSVRGYTRSNGTYLSPYNRSHSNRTVTDNYKFKGNVNPYTGREGHDYYRHSPTSPYYDGTVQNSKGYFNR